MSLPSRRTMAEDRAAALAVRAGSNGTCGLPRSGDPRTIVSVRSRVMDAAGRPARGRAQGGRRGRVSARSSPTWHPMLLRVAQIFVPSRAVAEEVVQETWLRVLGALDRFEGRSSLRTWVFRILVNTAKTRGAARGAGGPVLGARRPGRACRRRRSTPTASSTPTTSASRALVRRRRVRSGGAPARRRDPRRDRGGDRRAARGAASGDHAARRRWLGRGGRL